MENENYQRIEKALVYLGENFKNQPSLEEIAKSANLDKFYFQKIFKDWAGISPKKFLQVLTIEYLKSKISESKDIQTSTFDTGLSSTSRTHDLFVTLEAVSPAEYKNLGKNLVISYGFQPTPFGECLLALTEKGICGLQFITKSKEAALSELRKEWKNAKFVEDRGKTGYLINSIFNIQTPLNPLLKKGEIVAQKRDPEPSSGNYHLKLFVKGTNFQVQVWKALLQLHKGDITTYENIAKSIKNPKALRAVGTAVGSNKISYLIPCHRVINKMGKIGNYRWGKERKKAMIGWELSNNHLISNK